MTEESRAEKCNNGAQQWVCYTCAEKYRTRPPYDGTVTVHNGTCYICQGHTVVGTSRKYFGFHRFV